MDDPPPRVNTEGRVPERGDAPADQDAVEAVGRDSRTEVGDRPRRPDLPRPVRLLLVLVVIAAIAGLLSLVTDAPLVAVLGAVVLGALILRVGWFFLAQFATPPPPPPDPGTLRKVRLTYRCETCGTEVRMTSAATEDPEPPRHCMEDMELISSEE